MVWFKLSQNSETYRSVQNYELRRGVKQRHGRLGEPEPPPPSKCCSDWANIGLTVG